MRALPAALLLALLCGPSAPRAEDSKVLKDIKRAGKEIGKAGKEVGKEVGKAGKEIGRASAELGRDVKRVTTDYWDRALAAKRRRVAELKKENRELKEREGKR